MSMSNTLADLYLYIIPNSYFISMYIRFVCTLNLYIGGLRAGALKGGPVTKLNGINENLSLPGSALGVTQVAEGELDSDDEAGNMNTRYNHASAIYAIYLLSMYDFY